MKSFFIFIQIGILQTFQVTLDSEYQKIIALQAELHQAKDKVENLDKPIEHFQVGERTQPEPIINIDYIFNGYNILTGNPLTFMEPIDPGFTGRQIFNSQYTKQKISGDGRFKLPDGITVLNKKGCKFAFEGKTIHTKEDLKKYLSNFVDLDLALNINQSPYAFTASQEFNIIQNNIEKLSYTFVYSHTVCNTLQAQLDLNEFPPLSSSFIKALKTLPDKYEPGSYIDFFQTWGTHYIKQLTLGSRTGFVFSLPPEQILQFKGEKVQQKFKNDELDQAATITAALLKGVINTIILPKNQSSKAFTDLTKISLQTYSIELGPQPIDSNQRSWLQDTLNDMIPIKYSIGSIVGLLIDLGSDNKDIKGISIDKVSKNLQSGLIDYCKMLSTQNKRYGPCLPTQDMVKEQVEHRAPCLNFYEFCDFEGQNQYICGNRNPVQNIGSQLQEVNAASVKFYTDSAVIIGTVLFSVDYNQAVVLKSFHNDYIFLDKSEQCFINRELGQSTRVRVYITDPRKCFVVLMWNYCPGYAVRYFSSVLCSQFDVSDNFKAAINEQGSCEVALLDIRFPLTISLRICLFKNSKLSGQKTCFGSENAEQYYGQAFRSMVIDETEVIIHKSMPSSISVDFSDL